MAHLLVVLDQYYSFSVQQLVTEAFKFGQFDADVTEYDILIVQCSSVVPSEGLEYPWTKTWLKFETKINTYREKVSNYTYRGNKVSATETLTMQNRSQIRIMSQFSWNIFLNNGWTLDVRTCSMRDINERLTKCKQYEWCGRKWLQSLR